MREIDASNAAAYLTAAGLISGPERATIRELTGGVSNMVLLVERPSEGEASFVVKQARRQLRTRQPWFSRLERIWREVEVIEVCQQLLAKSAISACPICAGRNLPAIDTPRILYVDRENYLFAMTAAPGMPPVWKTALLAGKADDSIAAACAHLLASLHGLSWLNSDLGQRLGDSSLFEELRIDPYYRALAIVHPELKAELERLIAEVAENQLSLVHADFSPKNLLVGPAELMMVDFETGHFGDPAFDLGFFQSHLVLKAFYHAPRHEPLLRLSEVFWHDYRTHMAQWIEPDQLVELERRMILNFAGCALARIDGKSPVDYLDSPDRQDGVRRLTEGLLRGPAPDWPATIARCREVLDQLENEKPTTTNEEK
jgi:5-methylthioribose kinase